MASTRVARVLTMFATAAALCTGVAVATAPAGSAAVCGSVGGARVDVSGCADPFYELNDALPPPPPPAYVPPPPPPPPNVSVCADVGRRINVSGCV